MIFRRISLFAIVAVPLLSGSVSAQGFFDRGKEMLKGFGGGTESSGTASLGADEIAKGLKEAHAGRGGRVQQIAGCPHSAA